MGGGVLLQYWHLGDLGAPRQTFDSAGKNKFLEETARPQNQLWRKKGLTLINYVANFTSATPNVNSIEIIKCCYMIGHVYYMSLLIG